MPLRHSLRERKPLTDPPSPSSPPIATTRPRRAAAAFSTNHSRDQSDDVSSGEEGEEADKPRQTLRLTVKMPSSRLRDATSVATQDTAPVASTRSTRNIKKSYVVETSSEEEEDEEEQEDYADAEAEEDELAEEATPNLEQGEDEEDEEEAEEDDAEAEVDAELDADGDIEMDDDADDGVPLGHHPPPPILKVNPPAAPKAKPIVTVKPAESTKLKSVEAKEISMDDGDDDDDEELSELGSDDNDDDDDEEEAADEEDEDAEGEDIDEDEEDDDLPDADNDSRSPSALSRGTTPDINKMTKRQRSRLNEVYTATTGGGGGGGGGGFLELPMEPQVKKHLTAEEHAMRRAEMARRRKNLSEKRNEEEKQDTINRLLKKQAPKRRGKISAKEIEAQDRGDMSEAEEQAAADEEVVVLPANPVFVRWVSDRHGCRVGVPGEWLGAPAGEVFENRGGNRGNGSVKMVEEVEG